MILEKAAVIRHEKISPTDRRLTLKCGPSYAKADPGQFVMLHVPEDDSPLLPRPFSIHRRGRTRGGEAEIQILYRVVGAMTRKMTRVREGDAMDMVGPLGRGFTLPAGLSRPVLVAGGIGVAPLLFLAETILEKGTDPKQCHFFLGAQRREELLCREELQNLGIKVHVTTDDGSEGQHCRVTHPFQALAGSSPPDLIYACGPKEMLCCVAETALAMRIPCQVSVETLMACGIGACLGCAVEGSSMDRYLHVCSDGPVFQAEALNWNRQKVSAPGCGQKTA